ncbi:MAG TPA: TIGR00296 family protein [Thermoplasmata archaeon]|nr:TIGR00296 family protein [Thermoplasmata archaeon]
MAAPLLTCGMLSLEDGRWAIELARGSIAARLGRAPSAGRRIGDRVPPTFREPRGAFVTLKRHPSGELRGCIGYPLPVLPLAAAIGQAAVAAATEDPRFSPVRADELDRLTLEVSVLSVPVPVRGRTPAEIVAAIRVGRDGLIVEGDGTSGLLLPQVAAEMGWSAEELLDGTCEKAGLDPGAWRRPGPLVRSFEAEIFAERTPAGAVERVGE